MADIDAMLDDIVLMGDPVLTREASPIQTIDDEVRALAERMIDDMYAAEGCGLAAPQVGESVAMVVIDCDYGDGTKKNPYVLINPQIVEQSEETFTGSEGCLSFPGVTVEVERPRHVVVHAQNLDGELMRYEADSTLLARCLQHEIDHLNGRTLFESCDPRIRLEALQAYERARAAGARPGDTSLSVGLEAEE